MGEFRVRLDVSNTCAVRNVSFSANFVCNAAPEPAVVTTDVEVGLCFQRKVLDGGASTDADGDPLFVTWRPAQHEELGVFPDAAGTPTGAPNASAGLVLSDLVGAVTSFMPDVKGNFDVQLQVGWVQPPTRVLIDQEHARYLHLIWGDKLMSYKTLRLEPP